MGSIDYSIPIQLNSLGRSDSPALINTDVENIADTIWAITSFIYTGDNEVSFLKFAQRCPGGTAAPSTSSSQLHYYFDDGASAATVQKTHKEKEHHRGTGVPVLPHDNSLPGFTQLVKKVALLVTEDIRGSELLHELRATHKDLIILSVSLEKGSLVRMNFPDPRDYYSSLAHLAETIQTVGEVIASQNWATPLEQLRFLGPRNWQQIRNTAPETAKIGDSVLGDILIRQYQERPDDLAIEAWDGNLTYAELHNYARSMAAFLLMSGLQPEDRVGIYMKKSKWAMVAFFGILLAGCTGVPLDIRNPPKRTEALLQRVNAQYVIADEWTTPNLEGIEVGILPCHSSLLDVVDASDDSLLWPKVSPSAVAFILFTSGSTGLPKGVVIEHGPLYASIREIARELYIDNTSKVFQFSPYISDVSTGDIFATFYAGGTLFIPSEEQRLDSLADTLCESKASHAGLTSSVMSQVEPDQVPDLRYMIAVGEALSKDNLIRWSPHVCVISAYGITETLVFDSFASPEHLAADYRNIGIARGPCLWVTDLNNPERVMPIGAVGEVLIEGPLLAREYMGAPDLTAAKFIQAPSWLRKLRGERPNHRCYRSGDYGIRKADGTVLYLGRADNQVKIRGQRVELNEIEHSLLVCDSRVHQVAIELVRLENRGQDQALIAFIQQLDHLQDTEGDSSSPLLNIDDSSQRLFLDIKAKLVEAMPGYMVPTLFVPIRHMPKGALGKRDRNTLRRWGASLTADQLLEYGLRRQPSTARASASPKDELPSQVDTQDSAEFWNEQFPDTVDTFPVLPDPLFKPEARRRQSLNIELKRQNGSQITTETLVQAAWALVSSSYANAEETIFGLALHGKDNAGVNEALTTVPVRISFNSNSSISENLNKVQQYIARVKHHQSFGLQNIACLSDEAHSATAFQNQLVIQSLDKSGQTKEENNTLNYLLTLQVVIKSHSLHVTAHFDENIIPNGQIQSILAFFEHTISQLATESTKQSLCELDPISPHDQGLLDIWNAKMPATVNKTLHGMFEARAAITPDAVALESSTESLTYAELDRRAISLAKYLAEHIGGAEEPRVMLCFSKSIVPIIVMIAVLKLGGVCASINPEHPIARLADLSKDIDAALVLCDEAFVSMWESQESAPPALGIGEALIQKLTASSDSLETSWLPTVQPTNASFIIYTSGTTGKPKASVLEHRHLASGLSAVSERVGLDASSRTLQFSAYTFDAHILEIFTTLGRGGCVCVISDHERMNGLAGAIRQRRANIALLTKTVARLLEPSDVPTLRTLILAGEANGRQDYQRWAPHVRAFNGLGPSECTPLACVSTYPVAATDNPSNVGTPVGCRIWITNYRRPDSLVPIGCVGELTIEGPIIGRGYVNRPKENAAAFIQDPLWSRKGNSGSSPRRFYRTGDLAKLNPNGSITFISRADKQVKINGQRVELGEIEDHLRRQSTAFASSAVEVLTLSGRSVLAVFCARERRSSTFAAPRSDSGNPILTMGDKTREVFVEVQAKLMGMLPQYMVPTVFIPLTKLPINPSGKLERKKLHQWVAELDADALSAYYLVMAV